MNTQDENGSNGPAFLWQKFCQNHLASKCFVLWIQQQIKVKYHIFIAWNTEHSGLLQLKYYDFHTSLHEVSIFSIPNWFETLERSKNELQLNV